MSRASRRIGPQAVDRARATRPTGRLQATWCGPAHERGHPDIKPAHNAVFATLGRRRRRPPTWRRAPASPGSRWAR